MCQRIRLTVFLFLILMLVPILPCMAKNSEMVTFVSIKSIDLELNIIPEKNYLSGKATLYLEKKNDSDNLFVFFNTRSFKIIDLKDENGTDVKLDNPDLFMIKNITKGEHKFTVSYEILDNPKTKESYLIKPDLVELWDYTSWHPCLMGAQTINYNVKISLPANSNLEPVTCGDLIKQGNEGDKKVYYWTAENVRNGLSLFAAPYNVISKKYGDITYYLYTLEKNPKYGNDLLEFNKNVIEFMDKNYYKFPYKRFSMIEAPVFAFKNGRGVNSLCFMDSSVFPDIYKYMKDDFLVHEISHTYWGSIITGNLNKKEELFLNLIFFTEGMANFTGLDFHRYRKDKFAFEMSFMKNLRFFYEFIKKDKNGDTEPVKIKNIALGEGNKMTTLSKMALMDYYLSELIGPENYRKALHDIVDKFKWSTVEFNDFKEILYKYFPDKDKLDKFIDMWLQDSTLPVPNDLYNYFYTGT